MITKLKKIKGLGVFSNYQWDHTLPEFERYNIIYGWNRVGKTTLSNLFLALETGKLKDKATLEYEIETNDGNFKETQPFNRKVRVFNHNYITNNIELMGCTAQPVFILGEENKTIVKQIEDDEKLLNGDPSDPGNIGKLKELKEISDLQQRKEKERGQKFTDIAKIIGENTSGVTPRNYRKPDAETTFAGLKEKVILNDEEKAKCLLSIKQEEKPILEKMLFPFVISEKAASSTSEKVDSFELLEEIHSTALKLCAETVESVIIQRLKDNADISEWVETGLALHKTHKSDVCEFCRQKLPSERVKELYNYFNEADKKIKDSIEDILNRLRNIYSSLSLLRPIDKANLYKDYQNDYQIAVDEFEKQKNLILEKITIFGNILKEKKAKTTETVIIEGDLNHDILKRKVIEINDFIQKHNEKTNNFQKEKTMAQASLEKHYLSEIFDEVNRLVLEIGDCKKRADILQNGESKDPNILGIIALRERLKHNRATISSSHKGCEKNNERLRTFLGSNEIEFEVGEGGGYTIKRNGEIAQNLSEGEKMAIAFVHFTIRLQDKDFNIKEGIVVIDDPVSSLDSNSLFQAFAFLKNSVKEAHQIFIFTHNFDFLRLLLNWLKHVRDNVGKKAYFMLKNEFTAGKREAYLSIMDNVLKENESEYHYLFKLLNEFKSDGTIASVYHIPNIARKVLDTFLMFRVPDGSGTYQKLEKLSFDEDKKTAIYKFVNDQSHITGKGFDPSLVPETQNNVKYLLEMMKSVFPEHFDILENSFK